MALSYVTYDGDGSTTDFNVTFDYISTDHVHVYVDGAEDTDLTWLSASQLRMDTAPANGTEVQVKRETPSDDLLAYLANGSTWDADTDFNLIARQLLFINQELADENNDLVLGTVTDGSIGTAKLADEAVTEDKIADGAVTADKLDPEALSGAVADGSITNAKLANVATQTFKGRTTASSGVPEDLTVTQATAMLNAVVGDSGSGGTKGLVPAPAALDANKQRVLKASGSWGTVPRVRDSARNLVMAYATAATATITADEIVASDGTDYAVLSSVSLTVNITSSGANGLDTGAEASSAWYHAWVIYNPTTGTTAGLLSTSSTAPTMPSGYTFKAYVGAIRNDGSSNFVRFSQRGKVVSLATTVVFTNSNVVATNTYESISLANYIPPTAALVRGVIGQTGTGAARGIAVAADANGVGEVVCASGNSGATHFGYSQSTPFNIALITGQQVHWKADDSTAVYRLQVTGWEYP